MKKNSTRNMALSAVLTAIVIVLQFMGAFIRFGPFSVSAVLVPIVIGAATCGAGVGAWLGFVFGVTVLATGDAAAFFAVNIPGTIITVLLKGTLCGLFAALAYNALKKINIYAAVAVSAVVCPVVNTGIFLLGCLVFFMPTITEWAGGANAAQYMIVGLVGFNFLIETAVNVVLSPIIVRLLNVRNK